MKKAIVLALVLFANFCFSYANISNDDETAPAGYTIFHLSCGIKIAVPGDYTDTNGDYWCYLDKVYCNGGCD